MIVNLGSIIGQTLYEATSPFPDTLTIAGFIWRRLVLERKSVSRMALMQS